MSCRIGVKITPGAQRGEITPGVPPCPALSLARVLAASNNSLAHHTQWHELGAIVSNARAYPPRAALATSPISGLSHCAGMPGQEAALCNPSRLRTVIAPPAPLWHAL